MAFVCNQFMRRTCLSSLKSAARSKAATPSLPQVPVSSRATSAAPNPRRLVSFTRSPSELGCAQSLLPLHSTIAVARLTSCLSLNSRSCRSLSQDAFDDT